MNSQYSDAIEMSRADHEIDNLDIDYITESIESQLETLLTDSSKKNYLKKFIDKSDKLMKNHPDKSDEINNLKETIYTHIINAICAKFDISVDDYSLHYLSNTYKFIKTIYKFFVIEYIENITNFIEMYIVENRSSIVDELSVINENLRNKKISEVDQQTSVILNNVDSVIEIISNHNLGMDDFLEYLNKHPDSTASCLNMIEYCNSGLIIDADNIFKYIIKSLVNEDEGFSNIYTLLQLNLYNRFGE